MIFITSKDDMPLFSGYVNQIFERTMGNGGKILTYKITTKEIKNKDKENETKEYSDWYCNLMGNARKKCEKNPLKIGDYIKVKSFKQTNVTKKIADDEYKTYFNITISDYDIPNDNSQNFLNKKEKFEVSNEDGLPF